MKLKTILSTIVALAMGSTAAFSEDDTPLSKEMSAMNKALRTVKRQAADASKKAENLELVAKMKATCDAALKYEPAKTKDQPAGEKPAYLENFKKQMGELGKAIDELKAAIESGNADAATKVFEKLA
ncbi:MAG: cytochrome b562, partial [Chthoniobacteraceae bacterium]